MYLFTHRPETDLQEILAIAAKYGKEAAKRSIRAISDASQDEARTGRETGFGPTRPQVVEVTEAELDEAERSRTKSF